MNNKFSYERYNRQILLKEFGTASQATLAAAKVLVVGAGGLGCPALQYLAAAGVGTIGIVDFDVVDLSNLQRQTLYSEEDVGKGKVERAAEILRKLNSEIQVKTYYVRLDSKNAWNIIDEYDIVLDGTDNFSTRYLVNDACVLLDKPLVYGAVLRFEGQVGVFNFSVRHGGYKINYRDLFPVPPAPSTVPSCNEAGVIGVLPGIIGTMQAAEVIKLITGIGEPLSNKVLSYNMLTNRFYEVEITTANSDNNSFPKERSEFECFNYDWFCGVKDESFEISVDDFDTLKKRNTISIVDVREFGELPVAEGFSCIQIPLSQLKKSTEEFPVADTSVIFCQSGKRSLVAVELLKEKFPQQNILSLRGGIEAWKKYQLNPTTQIEALPEKEIHEDTQGIY